MKNNYDERQNQILKKYSAAGFMVMFLVGVISILIQLVVLQCSLITVSGETIVVVSGGLVYLAGVIKAGCFSGSTVTGSIDKKQSVKIHVMISLIISAVFSILYGVLLYIKCKDWEHISGLGKYVVLFFVLITILCFVALTILDLLTKRSVRIEEEKYADVEDNDQENDNKNHKNEDVTMQPERVYLAQSSFEADMLIEELDKHGIPAFKKSIDGGIMDVYSGNSNKGDYLYVDQADIERAKEIIEQFKIS